MPPLSSPKKPFLPSFLSEMSEEELLNYIAERTATYNKWIADRQMNIKSSPSVVNPNSWLVTGIMRESRSIGSFDIADSPYIDISSVTYEQQYDNKNALTFPLPQSWEKVLSEAQLPHSPSIADTFTEALTVLRHSYNDIIQNHLAQLSGITEEEQVRISMAEMKQRLSPYTLYEYVSTNLEQWEKCTYIYRKDTDSVLAGVIMEMVSGQNSSDTPTLDDTHYRNITVRELTVSECKSLTQKIRNNGDNE